MSPSPESHEVTLVTAELSVRAAAQLVRPVLTQGKCMEEAREPASPAVCRARWLRPCSTHPLEKPLLARLQEETRVSLLGKSKTAGSNPGGRQLCNNQQERPKTGLKETH